MPDSSIEFHEAAAIEFDAAFDWYLQRSPEAALRFSAELDRAVGQIVKAAERWAVGPFHTRKFLLRQFPLLSSTVCVLLAPFRSSLSLTRVGGLNTGKKDSDITGDLRFFPL